MENVSLDLDLDHNEDDDEMDDRHKEIQGLLSTAFDDLSSLSEDEDEYSNEFKKFTLNGDNDVKQNVSSDGGHRWTHQYDNGLTSTPLLRNQLYTNGNNNLWSKASKPALNVSDILEAEEEDDVRINGPNIDDNDNDNQFCVKQEHKMNGQFDSKSSSLENPRTDQLFGNNERSFSQKHVQLLIEENQRLSNELIVSQQKLSAIDGNYEGMQYRLQELNQMNAEKENQLVKLEARIRSLEVNIKVERDAKEEFQRKVSVCESTIESLQYQLMEIEKSDCLVRRQEIHDSVVNSLKSKHDNELLSLKTEIERLRAELSVKETQINTISRDVDKCQSSESLNEQFKQMIKTTKDLWEQEMKGRIEKDIKDILDLHERNWSKSAEQKMANERSEWEQELQIEILEITKFLRIKAKVSADTLPECVSLRFVSLMSLWRALEDSCDQKEHALRMQTEKLKEAKRQLEEALDDSRHNQSVSPSNCPSNDHILRELRNELQKVSEEAMAMKEKLHKYKLHYHQLIRKHKHEIERIKQEFAHILESLKRDFK